MEQIFQMLTAYIDTWGYLAVLVLMALESACIPVPSELILGFAGYLVFLGRMDFVFAVIAGVAGGLVGSLAAYLAGFYGGQPFIRKYGRYIFISQKHVDFAQKWFDRYGLQMAFYSRMLPVLRTFISLPAGFARVNLIKFSFYTILGSVPWTIGLLYAGKLLGKNWHRITDVGHEASLVVAVLIIIAVVYYWRRNRKKHDILDK